MLMRPNKAETAVHGCHCPGDMAVRMRKVLARPWVGVRVCHLLLLLFLLVAPGRGALPIMAYTRRLRPKGVPFFKLQVYKGVGNSQVEVYKRVGKSVI